MKIVLASQSPRRRELMEQMGLCFTVAISTKPEQVEDGLSPAELCQSLARQKAEDVFLNHPDACVIGADTIVVLNDGMVLGKPKDEQDAKRMLSLLEGKTHTVYTGLSICVNGRNTTAYDSTAVTFSRMNEEEIRWYVSTGEPMDKAGAYGIQGLGCRFIERIDGNYFTVMGLPVQVLYQKLKELQVL